MPNIAKDKNDLEKLLYGSSRPSQTEGSSPQGAVDPKGEDIVEQKPVIEFDYAKEMAEFRRNCRKTVMTMASHVLSEDLMKHEYIKDKMEQDIDTLAELYWSRRSNELMKLSIMDSIAHGNTAPRMYDSYASICDRISDNNKQIIETENNLRKTYLELKYEVQSRDAEAEIERLNSQPGKGAQRIQTTAPAGIPFQKQGDAGVCDGPGQQDDKSINRVNRGTKNLLNQIRDMKRAEYIRAREVKDNAEDAVYTEIQQDNTAVQ